MSNLKKYFHSFGNLWILHFCDFTKWHYAILWNHKNAKSIVICLNLKITKEGGNSRQFFPATFLKIKFQNWPGLNFRGWPTWKTMQQSSFFQHVGSSFFGIHLVTVYVFSLLGAISETDSSSLQPHPPMNLPPSTHTVISCFFSHAVMFAEEILRPCIGFHNKALRWNLDMTMSNCKITVKPKTIWSNECSLHSQNQNIIFLPW